MTMSLQGPADTAILADTPEMDGDEQGRRQGDGDAMQDIKSQERIPAHKAPAQENKARIAPRMDQIHISDTEQLGAWSLVSEERRGPAHVTADGDRPNRQLVPGQQVAREAQH